MDERIARAIESAYSLEREHGFPRLEAMRSDAVFAALHRLGETQDVGVLEGCPEWLIQELREWVATFKRMGSFVVVSHLGEADHTELMRRVAPLLDDAI